MNCTNCGSENTQRLEVICDGGTTTSVGRTAGVATGHSAGGGPGVGGYSGTTRTTSKTDLAQKCAGPAKKGYGFAILLIIVGLIAGFMYFAGAGGLSALIALASFGGAYFLIKNANSYNGGEWPRLHSAWLKKWYCHKCGTTFSQA